MKHITALLFIVLLGSVANNLLHAQSKFKAVVLTERGGNLEHESFVVAALDWLSKYSKEINFEYIVINKPDTISEAFLSNYRLFIQLNYPPYRWPDQSKAAFEDYVDNGKGAWIGFHHASLLGEFDGYAMWPWFHDFMGSIRFKNYIATFVSATVNVEDKAHPVMKKIPAKFFIEKEEFYTYDASPRANVHVLASVDEGTYSPNSDIKMGDHPVVWTNPKYKARNVYIFMGHDPSLFKSADYKVMFSNAIGWASQK